MRAPEAGAPSGDGASGAGATPGWRLDLGTPSAAATRALGGALAGTCRAGDLVLLVGDLGSGKTTLVQGFAAALGVAEPVTSPTFTLVQQYDVAGGPVRQVVHADVYRLESPEEMDDLAIGELVEDGAVGLVEWGDRAAGVLGPDLLVVTLVRIAGDEGTAGAEGTAGDEGRRVVVEAVGPGWASRRAEVADALAGFASEPPLGAG